MDFEMLNDLINKYMGHFSYFAYSKLEVKRIIWKASQLFFSQSPFA